MHWFWNLLILAGAGIAVVPAYFMFKDWVAARGVDTGAILITVQGLVFLFVVWVIKTHPKRYLNKNGRVRTGFRR